MAKAAALAEIEAVKSETFAAADRLLESIDAALALMPKVRNADAAAMDALQAVLCDMLEAMTFQDITGQRLTRIASLLNGLAAATGDAKVPSELSLENGPALPGGGVSQDDADALMRRQK